MTGRFKVTDVQARPEERELTAFGHVLEGDVTAGMLAELRASGFRGRIETVEPMSPFSDSAERAIVLTFRIATHEDASRSAALLTHGSVLDVSGAALRHACPCCGHLTLDEEPPGTYDICPVCCWEDDPVQYKDVDYEGGANQVSLRTARRNYIEHGVSEDRFRNLVRGPRPEETRSEG